MKRLVVFIFCLLLVVSCSKKQGAVERIDDDGIKIISNTTTPLNKDFSIELKKVLEISAEEVGRQDSAALFSNPLYFDLDSQDNIYIFDLSSSSVKKFDNKGRFVTSIGKRGAGPGEMQNGNSLVVLKDTVYIGDPFRNKMVIFNSDGEFIRNDKLDYFFQLAEGVGDDKIISFVPLNEVRDDVPYFSFTLGLFDKNFTMIDTLNSKYYKVTEGFKLDYTEIINPYCVSNNEIYMAVSSRDFYRINVYNFDGKIKYRIEKSYRKLAMTEEEIKEINDMLDRINGEGNNDTDMDSKFKKACNRLLYDGKYLWSVVSVERNEGNKDDFIVDIFRDGVFINRVVLDEFKGNDYFDVENNIKIKNNKLYFMNLPDAKMIVYDIIIKS